MSIKIKKQALVVKMPRLDLSEEAFKQYEIDRVQRKLEWLKERDKESLLSAKKAAEKSLEYEIQRELKEEARTLKKNNRIKRIEQRVREKQEREKYWLKAKLSPEEKKIRQKKAALKYARANPEKMRENVRLWHIANPGYLKRYYLKARKKLLMKSYGLTPEQVEIMDKTQKNKCGICKKEMGNGKSRHVDHNHKTNKVRGLLCNKCNLGLGFFQDNLHLLNRASDYLRLHK